LARLRESPRFAYGFIRYPAVGDDRTGYQRLLPPELKRITSAQRPRGADHDLARLVKSDVVSS